MKPIRKNLLKTKTVSAIRLFVLEQVALGLLLENCETAIANGEPISDTAKHLKSYFDLNGVDAISRGKKNKTIFGRVKLTELAEPWANAIEKAAAIRAPGAAVN